MGIYLNPGNRSFRDSLNSEVYVDKSEIPYFRVSADTFEDEVGKQRDGCRVYNLQFVEPFGALPFSAVR